jgi:hypothetical protein
LVWLLGCAAGAPAQVSAIHGPRLERLLERLVDTPVRGVAYEASGSAPASSLRSGRAAVERAGERWRIPVGMLEADRNAEGWAGQAAEGTIALVG